MKLAPMITALLIGTSTMASIAVAQPSSSGAYHRHRRPHARADRTPTPYTWTSDQGWIPPVVPNNGSYEAGNPYDNGAYYDDHDRGRHDRDRDRDRRWTTLVGNITSANERQFVHVGPQLGRFHEIRVDVLGGNMYVQQIGIEYDNKDTQKVIVQAWMNDRNNPSLVFDVGEDRPINRIIVYTSPNSRAQYRLSGN